MLQILRNISLRPSQNPVDGLDDLADDLDGPDRDLPDLQNRLIRKTDLTYT